ncbi:hypothetical protein GCM10010327_47900 [Streptomyces nitrosporeus]|nr:hypothetical protein GCM10010327_47900 [Streptomyces nitrosporeus]
MRIASLRVSAVIARKPAPGWAAEAPAAAADWGTAVDWVVTRVTEPSARAAATPAARAFFRYMTILPPDLVGELPQDVAWSAGGVRRQLARLWP